MAQYTTGSVSITGGTNTVTGLGTLWLANINVGDEILFSDDDAFWTVGSVDSDTQLTLTANYPDTLTDEDYQITSDFTSNFALPKANAGDLRFDAIYTRAMMLIDTILTTSQGPPAALVFSGDLEVTDWTNQLRMQKALYFPVAATINRVQVTGIDGSSFASGAGSGLSTVFNVSDNDFGQPSGSLGFTATLPGEEAQVSQTGSLAIAAGSWLYVFISAASGGHVGAQLLIHYAI